VTPYRVSVVPEVLLSQEVPLSDEVRMVPDTPPVTKSPFPYVTSQSLSDAPEVLLSQVVPSEEVRMVPKTPTVTNNPVEVVVLSVVVLSVLVVLDELLDEEQDMEMKLKRRRERMMSICFTWFPYWWFRRTQCIPELGLFYKNVGVTWRCL